MALSGSNTVAVGSYWSVILEWSATQSIPNNTSTVTAKLYWQGNNAVSSSATKDWSITINGNKKTGTASASLSAGQKKLIGTHSVTIPHNADGTKSFSLSGTFGMEVTLSGTYYSSKTVSGSYTLNTIPRASTLSSDANWTAGNNKSISINRASSSFTHTVKLYVDGTLVKTITGVGASTTASFTTAENTTIFGELAGSATKSTKIELLTYSGSTHIGTTSKTGTVTAPSASTGKISNPANVSVSSGQGASTVYIDQSTTIAITRANSGFTHTIKFKDANGGNVIHTATGVGTSYTWTPTQAQKDTLYAKTPNGIEFDGEVEIITYYNGKQVRSSSTLDINYRVRNSNPSFSASYISYADINSTTTGITGNNQYIIQGKSNLRAYINTGATALNKATISKYEITINGVMKSLTTTGYVDFGVINASSNITMSVKAIDSRGFSTTVSKTITVIPYTAPQINTVIKRVNNFEDTTNFTASVIISPLTIGGVVKNTLTSATPLKYRYKASANGTWSSYINIPLTTNTSTSFISGTNSISLDNTKAWDVEFVATDKLGSVTITKKVNAGSPLFFIDADKNSIGVNKLPTANNALDVKGDVYVDGAGGELLRLSYNSGNSGFITWYEGGTRRAYLGFGSGASDITLKNEKNGSIMLTTNGKNAYLNPDGEWIVNTLKGTSGAYILFGSDTTSAFIQSKTIYNRTNSNSANVYITENGTLVRSTSASKYKMLIEPYTKYKGEGHEKNILKLTPKSWYDKATVEANAEYMTKLANGEEVDENEDLGELRRHYGLIAEDLIEAGLEEFVVYGAPDENGHREVEGIEYDRVWTMLIPIIKEHEETIKEQQKRIEELENKNGELERRLEQLEQLLN